ncbi:hypothetical protein [Minwuia sp. IMCC3060]|jgi:hypothetical protein|uniref:hypothetical protein n=1 Tax=Minwuia sp. IMCC3060 TaxID=3040675 RepID=UPI00247A0DA2|nr:hypothetical protein [Minwuia sp. IMCC3060]
MSEVNIIIRTADQTRKAEVTMAREHTGGDVIQAAVDNWSLPGDTDYALVNSTNGKSILPDQALGEGTVKEGDILEVQPVLVAG